jgi:hypothetical protein
VNPEEVNVSTFDRPSRLRDVWAHHGEAVTTAVVLTGWLAAHQGTSALVTVPLYLAAYVVGGTGRRSKGARSCSESANSRSIC